MKIAGVSWDSFRRGIVCRGLEQGFHIARNESNRKNKNVTCAKSKNSLVPATSKTRTTRMSNKVQENKPAQVGPWRGVMDTLVAAKCNRRVQNFPLLLLLHL